jgi:hypothetical protein
MPATYTDKSTPPVRRSESATTLPLLPRVCLKTPYRRFVIPALAKQMRKAPGIQEFFAVYFLDSSLILSFETNSPEGTFLIFSAMIQMFNKNSS